MVNNFYFYFELMNKECSGKVGIPCENHELYNSLMKSITKASRGNNVLQIIQHMNGIYKNVSSMVSYSPLPRCPGDTLLGH
jgi:hypothetical protein